MLIVFVILVISIILHVVLKKMGQNVNKEYFSQFNPEARKGIKNIFGQQSCASLMVSSDVNPIPRETARTYLETGRFKTWKPSPKTQLDPSFEYCYVNNDKENNEQDYFMSGHTCDKSDGNFKNVSFISDVFSDNDPQTTATRATNKCVFKIDKGMATKEALGDFWTNTVATTECIKKEKYIIELNQWLSDKKDGLQVGIDRVKNDIAGQVIVIDKLNQDIDDATRTKDARISEKFYFQNEINSLATQNTQLQKDIDQVEKNCSENEATLRRKLDVCVGDSNDMTEKYSGIAEKLGSLESSMASFKIVYDELTTDINIQSGLLNSLQDKYNSKETLYNNVVKSYSECSAQLKDCDQNNWTCQSNLTKDDAYKNEQFGYYQACSNDLANCQGSLSVCRTSSNTFASNITMYKGKLSQCIKDKAYCIATDANVKTQIVGLKQDYVFAQDYYNSTSCDALIKQQAKLEFQEADLLARCQRMQNQGDSAQTGFTQSINATTATLDTKLKTCQANVEKIRSTMLEHHVTISSHIAVCNKGESCKIQGPIEGWGGLFGQINASFAPKVTCQSFCDKYLPGKDAKYTGNYLNIDTERTGCFCTYDGESADIEIAKQANLKAFNERDGSMIPDGPYKLHCCGENGDKCVAKNSILKALCSDVPPIKLTRDGGISGMTKEIRQYNDANPYTFDFLMCGNPVIFTPGKGLECPDKMPPAIQDQWNIQQTSPYKSPTW